MGCGRIWRDLAGFKNLMFYMFFDRGGIWRDLAGSNFKVSFPRARKITLKLLCGGIWRDVAGCGWIRLCFEGVPRSYHNPGLA